MITIRDAAIHRAFRWELRSYLCLLLAAAAHANDFPIVVAGMFISAILATVAWLLAERAVPKGD